MYKIHKNNNNIMNNFVGKESLNVIILVILLIYMYT